VSTDLDILAIPDSTAWRAGVLHERERTLRILHQLREQAIIDRRFSPDAKPEILHALQRAASAIREAP
jgi:hypothetical protein